MLTVTNTLLAQWYDAGRKVRDSLTFPGLNPKSFSLFQSIFLQNNYSQAKLVVWGKLPMHLVVYFPSPRNYQIGSLG